MPAAEPISIRIRLPAGRSNGDASLTAVPAFTTAATAWDTPPFTLTVTLPAAIVSGMVTDGGSVIVTVPQVPVRPETAPELLLREKTGPKHAGTRASVPTVKLTAKLAVAFVTVGETPNVTLAARAGVMCTPALVGARSMRYPAELSV